MKFYCDHNIPRAIVDGLRIQGVDVLTAYEDGYHTVEDPILLARANELGRPLFTMDDDLLVEASKLLSQHHVFTGVIYIHQRRAQIGQCIADLLLISRTTTLQDMQNEIIFLPL